MKLFNLIITFLIVLVFSFSCEEKKVEKIEFDAEIETTEKKIDSTLIELVDLPYRIDSTNYIIHIKGFLNKQTRNKYISWSYSSDEDYYNNSSVSYYDRHNYIFSGNITNVKCQQVNSTKLIQLTDKKIVINSIEYLKSINKQIDRQILLYHVHDMDTNKDKKINSLDIESLYISNIDGTNFMKLSTKYHQLLDWKIIVENSTLYFRSKEDINQNGKFELSDKIHYQFINLSEKQWKVQSYNPL